MDAASKPVRARRSGAAAHTRGCAQMGTNNSPLTAGVLRAATAGRGRDQSRRGALRGAVAHGLDGWARGLVTRVAAAQVAFGPVRSAVGEIEGVLRVAIEKQGSLIDRITVSERSGAAARHSAAY